MDGFKRPMRPTGAQPTPSPNRPVSQAPGQLPPVESFNVSALPAAPQPTSASSAPIVQPSSRQPKSPRSKRRLWLIIFGVTLLTFIIVAMLAYQWYQAQLTPVNAADTTTKRIIITERTTISSLSDSLSKQGLIRNKTAFELYARLSGQDSKIQVGTCSLKPSNSTNDILNKITAGCHDFTSLMFYPGGTLESSTYKASHATGGIDKTSVRYVLKQAGFSDAEITAAFAQQYTGDILADKPASAGLEGYVFGETYYVDKKATVEEVIQTALDHFSTVAAKNDLTAKFKAQGLTLFQGITLASIVERELGCEDKPTEARKQRCYSYQQGIAAVFLNRLKTGMTLGSDVTFIYAADLKGVTPTVDIDSPYNTRINTGLPPGPIAAPGELALKSVANPTSSDYLYFIAGDDGLIYFAKTNEEHEANVKNHCQQLCSEL